MNASVLERNSVDHRLVSLTTLVEQLCQEVADLRSENAELRQQVHELRCDVSYWKSMHSRAVERCTKTQAELEKSKAEVRQLKAERFGKQSEKKSGTDRSNDLDVPQESAVPKNKRGQQPGHSAPKRRDYSHLPAREQQVDLPENAKDCACCGKPLADLGQSDPCEQIEIETILYRRVVRRKRYRRTCQCKNQPRTVTAPLPAKILPKSIYGTSIWIHLLLEKFHLQRPTHRTIEQLRLLGASLAPGTIADGLKRIEPLITPIYDAIRDRHTQSKYFHADETRWKVFVEKSGKKGHLWWLWLFAGEDSIVYVLDSTRSHDVPESHFPNDVQGVLMVDRYSAYKAMEQVKDGLLVLAFCWAHVRRDFVKIGKGYPELVPWAIQWVRRIGKLYRLNRVRLTHQIGSESFTIADAALRQHINEMATQREVELAGDMLRAPCRKALVSLAEHWSGLTLFVDDPRIPMDNNYGERLIRNPAVGRKNYYGSGAQWAGRLAVMMFSICATLTHWKINPHKWLSWYFEACAENGGKAPTDSAPFLPWNLSPDCLDDLRKQLLGTPTADTS